MAQLSRFRVGCTIAACVCVYVCLCFFARPITLATRDSLDVDADDSRDAGKRGVRWCIASVRDEHVHTGGWR